MKQVIKIFLILTLVFCVFGCPKRRKVKLPPVEDGWRRSNVSKNAYIVQKKDTLYSIAWAFGLDYRDLASVNKLESPYKIRRGQKIYIGKPPSRAKSKVSYKKKKSVASKPLKGWMWPTRGKVISGFTKKLGGNHGVNIKGVYGQSVMASNSGKVVYSGGGIRSYGKLIIIKHNDDYLSAYAYNQHMLVKEGQEVKRGHKIATMGKDSEGRAVLHFEIRRFGKPVNPKSYLTRTN